MNARPGPAEKFVPLQVVAAEAERLGWPLDPKSLLLGYLLGRATPAKFQDAEHLRFLVQTLAPE